MKRSHQSAPLLYFNSLTAWPGHGVRPPHALTVAGTHAPTIVHRPQRLRQRPFRPYPSRAMLVVLLLVATVAVAACWNAKPGSGQGIDLRAGVGSPKVNTTSAQNPPAQAPKLLEIPTLPPTAFYGPGSLACSCFHDLLQGDSPMLHTWNVLKMTSVMAVALTVTPLSAWSAEPGDTELEKLSKLVKELKKACDDQKDTSDKQNDALGKVAEKLDKLINNTTKGFDGINADLTKVKADVKGLTDDHADTKLTLQSALAKIRTLEEQMGLQKKRDPALYPGAAMDDLKERLEKIETTLRKLADGRISLSPPTGAGKIQLANLYPEEILFVINNKPYRVPPNTTMDLPNQPAGSFTYEVISGTYGLRARNTPLLEAGKTYTITVR
jgi:hypothetical protein